MRITTENKQVLNTLALFAVVMIIPILICALSGDTTTALALVFLYLAYLLIIGLFVLMAKVFERK